MREIRAFLIVFFLVSVIPALAQQTSKSSMPMPREITGTVVSFSADILDIQPPASSAVWVTIPESMKVNRSALKPGDKVSVEARWDTVSYIATQAPEVVTAAKPG